MPRRIHAKTEADHLFDDNLELVNAALNRVFRRVANRVRANLSQQFHKTFTEGRLAEFTIDDATVARLVREQATLPAAKEVKRATRKA